MVRNGVAAAIAIACLALAPAASARTSSVEIKSSGFDPAVLVVTPGTEVEWANRDSRTHDLKGDFESPSIGPGGKFKRRFPRLGIYEYRDGANAPLTGTIIVAAGVRGGTRYPPPTGPRLVAHHWRVSLRYDVSERWRYMDGKFLSFDGICNAQVGSGSREVSFHTTFPDVRYARVGRLEVMSGKSRPYGVQRYRETIDSKTSNPESGDVVDCGDGSNDPPPEVEQKCDHNYAGIRVRAELMWSPRVANGRFQWPHTYLGRTPKDGNCGHNLLAGALVGLDPDQLPWDPGAGALLLYDHGRTGPATLRETRALRKGRPLTVTRYFELHFTVDCCVEWHELDKPGTYVRVGARHEAKGRVTIRFVPERR